MTYSGKNKKTLKEINSNIINAENIAAESVLEMGVIKNEFDNFMSNERNVQDFVDDTLEIKRYFFFSKNDN